MVRMPIPRTWSRGRLPGRTPPVHLGRGASHRLTAVRRQSGSGLQPVIPENHKISNSVWRWGYGKAGKYAGVFLDGSFGFHVMHAGRRVMTIGFSVAAGRRILINQIQSASPKGNRWMFRFPPDRVATVVEAFRRSFPTHTIHLVDGDDAVRRIMEEYETGVTRRERNIVDWREEIARGSCFRTEHHIEEAEAEIAALRAKISHLSGDGPRISDFYRGSDAFRLGAELTANGLKHREVLPLAA